MSLSVIKEKFLDNFENYQYICTDLSLVENYTSLPFYKEKLSMKLDAMMEILYETQLREMRRIISGLSDNEVKQLDGLSYELQTDEPSLTNEPSPTNEPLQTNKPSPTNEQLQTDGNYPDW